MIQRKSVAHPPGRVSELGVVTAKVLWYTSLPRQTPHIVDLQ